MFVIAKSACCYHASGTPRRWRGGRRTSNAMRRFNYFQHRYHTCGVKTAPNDSTADASVSRVGPLILWTRKVKYSPLFIIGVGCPSRLCGVATVEIDVDYVHTRVYELNDRALIFSGLDPRSKRPRDLESATFESEHDLSLHLGCHTPSNRQDLPP